MGAWDSFRTGQAARGALEDRRDREAYGEAFALGGYDAAEEEAGSRGDFETAGRVQAGQRRNIELARENATVLGNAATSLLQLPYEEREERLMQMRPYLESLGIPTERLDTFDPTDEALEGIRAINGKFTEFEDIVVENGNIVGLRADGTHAVIGPSVPGAAPQGYQRGEDGQMRPTPGSPVPGMAGYRFNEHGAIEEIDGYGDSIPGRQAQATIDYTARRPGGRGRSSGAGADGAAGQYTIADLAPQERTYINQSRADGERARRIARDLARFEHLNRTQATGELNSINILDPELQEMRSISEGLVSFMRQPGEGAMSDGDAARFRASLPSVGKLGPANSNIIRAFQAASQNSVDYVTFLEYFASHHGTTTGASELWDEYLNANPLLDDRGEFIAQRQNWRQYFGVGGQETQRRIGARGAPGEEEADQGAGDNNSDPLGIR